MIVDIYSDTICPWCFIGKRRLERALAVRPQPDLAFRWRPFQLNPDMPAEGMERQRYLALKFGGVENAQRVYDHIASAGQEEDIAFNFAGIGRTPNTLDSHRLIRMAEESEAVEANLLVQALFDAYFLEGRDIGQAEVLSEIAAGVGMDRAAVERLLAGDEGIDAIRAEDAFARNSGITGVPCFVFNTRYALPGAQPPEVLLRMFDTMHSENDAALRARA